MSEVTMIVGKGEDDARTLKSPGVGYWRRAPKVGTILTPGQSAGVLSTLGRDRELIVPAGGGGVVLSLPTAISGESVAFGDTLVVLGEAGTAETTADEVGRGGAAGAGGALAFCAVSSGRFYVRPAPDKPPFVSVGDVVEAGQTVYLLEVMKTFSRVTYGGDGLPERARVARIVPADGDDLEAGQVVLELEPAS